MSDIPGHGSAPKCHSGVALFFCTCDLGLGFVSEGDLDNRPPIMSLRGKSAWSRMLVSAVSDRLNPTTMPGDMQCWPAPCQPRVFDLCRFSPIPTQGNLARFTLESSVPGLTFAQRC